MRGSKDRVNVIARRAMPDVAISYGATPQIPSWGYSLSEEVVERVCSCSFVRFSYKNERTNSQHQYHVGCGYIKVYPQGRDERDRQSSLHGFWWVLVGSSGF